MKTKYLQIVAIIVSIIATGLVRQSAVSMSDMLFAVAGSWFFIFVASYILGHIVHYFLKRRFSAERSKYISVIMILISIMTVVGSFVG